MMLPAWDASAPLPNPLDGTRRIYRWRGYDIAYVVHGPETSLNEPVPTEPPLVYVHSIHAAAWSAEWRFVFGSSVPERASYALDLLGFGASEHPPLRYTAQLYIELVRDFLREIVREPAVLIGSSLGATYAIAVAAEHPELAAGVVAIGPAGISRLTEPGGALNRGVEALFRTKVPGTALFRSLVSRPSIRFFLKDIYSDPASLTPEAVELFYRSAHHPNARYAPAAFVGMSLNRDIRAQVASLTSPLLLVWGTRASQTPFREARQVRALVPDATFEAIESGDLPHEESPEDFLVSLLSFLGEGAKRRAPQSP